MTIKVDLKTRILSPEHRAFMIRSGKEYHLFDRFIEHQAVAPDLPELEVKNGEAPTSDDSLDNQVKRARALRDWALLPLDRDQPKPSLELDDYTHEPLRKQHGLYVNSAQDVLWTIPRGSLIYVPNPSFLKDGLFGEIGDAEAERVRFPGQRRMAGFTFQGRPLGKTRRLPMRELPTRLLELKSLRVGVTQLRRDDQLLLYRQYYGGFVVAGQLVQSEVETTKDYFSPTDATIVSALANMIQENLDRMAASGSGTQALIGINDAAFLDLGSSGLQIHADINSPGTLQVYAEALAPLVFKAFFALSLAVPIDALAQNAQSNDIEVLNSLAADGSTEHKTVQQDVVNLLQLIGANDLERTVELVRAFNERTGGKVDAEVE